MIIVNKEEKTKEFIKKAKEIWGDKYDYTDTVYENSEIPLKLKWNGFEILQLARLHLSKKLPSYETELLIREKNRNDFFNKAKDIWGNKYDYPDTVFINTKCDITYKWGEYSVTQNAGTHIAGKVSKFESDKTRNFEYKRYTTETFIKKASTIWGNKYDYKLTKYVNNTTPINFEYQGTILTHTPMCHLEGKLSKSELDLSKNGQNYTEHFISRVKSMYGVFYDYSKVIYVNNRTEVILIHDGVEYLQTPKSIFNNQLPKELSQKIINNKIYIYIYIIKKVF